VLRDLGFYFISLSVLVVASITGELSFYYGIVFFLLYIIFVILVVVMDKIEERQKQNRKEMRKTLAVKRATIGNISAQEQEIMDDADLDDEAYYYKDENDHLVEIKIEKEQIEEEEGNFKDKFHRALTNMTDPDAEDIENQGSDSDDGLDDKKQKLIPKKKVNFKIQNEQSVIETSIVETPIKPEIKSVVTK
jgi:Ca2+/Na+ antiporter